MQVPLQRFDDKYSMNTRTLCPTCNESPVAVNYIKDETVHYRTRCSACIRKGRGVKKIPPAWAKSGYKKKDRCELCSFKFKLVSQCNVFYVDGNLKNTNWSNFKTVCLNCQQELYKSKVTWKPAPIVPDF